MILIAGWVGGKLNADQGMEAAEAMTAGLLRGVSPRLLNRALKRAGDHLGTIIADDVAEDGALLAGISGQPRWTDDDLAAMARDKGHAHALLAGYGRFGGDVLTRVKGAFSLAVANRQDDTMLAAIDRAGISGLCRGRAADGAAVFAASADAVAAYPAMKSTVRPQAVYEYLFHYTVPAPLTIYTEQQKLLPGQCVTARPDGFETSHYWRMPYTEQATGDFESWSARFQTQIRESFARTIEGLPESDLGAFLSGGLDSSTVTGLLAETVGQARSFTIGFDEPRYDERYFARLAVRKFGTESHEYVPTPDDVLDLMPRIAEVYDEPYGNTSAVPAYLCARMARENGVSVMLAGDGGDEIFAGNERYAYMKRVERYGLIPAPVRKVLLEPLLSPAFMDRVPVAGKARRLARRFAIPMPDRLYSHGFMLGADSEGVFSPEWYRGIDTSASLAGLRAVYQDSGGKDILQRMMALDLKTTLADNDLRKVNRMCALAGVDVRYPMLDDDLMTFAATIPSDLLLPGDRLRDFFKRSMSGFLPEDIITKEKHGFGLPFEEWVKSSPRLKDAVRDLLLDARKRPIFDRGFVERVEKAATADESSPLDGMAWDIAMLELWLNKRSINV
jgi:asparagine synthase (glutamine-hydrolysing)